MPQILFEVTQFSQCTLNQQVDLQNVETAWSQCIHINIYN